jgi:hypothetical protein
VVERSARVRMPLRKLAVYLAYQTDCQRCTLREQCLAKGAKGDRARRVSAVRRLLPSPATVRAKAGHARTNALGGCSRASTSSHLDCPLAWTIRRGACTG